MAARRVLYLSHVEADGDVLGSKTITVTKADGSALGVSLYEQVSGGSPVISPQTDSLGTKLLYANDADLDAAGFGRVKVSYSDNPSTTFDDAFWPDPADLFIDGMTRSRSLTGGLTVTRNSASAWAETVKNTNSSGRSLTVLDPNGLDVFTILRAGGVDCVGIGLQDSATYLTGLTRLLVAMTATVSSVMADFQFNSNGGDDSGALRAVFNQTVSGATWGRAGEFQTVRTTGDALTWGVEIGTHSSITSTYADPDARIVGAYIANQEAGWLAGGTGVRGDSAVLIQGDKGWRTSILARDIDSTTVLLRGVSHTTGNDIKGDLMAAGRIYSQNLGSTYRIGVVNYNTAPNGLTDAGVWFDTTANRKALLIGAALGGTGYFPVQIASEGGNVGIGVPQATLGSQSGAIPVTLQVGTGGTIAVLKTAGVTTPPTNYSSIGPSTDEHWYIKTSGAATKQIIDSTGPLLFAQNEVVTGVISPAQLTANTDDWNPTGLATARVIRVSTDASRNLTGIAAQTAGTIITICNVGAQNLVLIDSATSSAANQFALSANITLAGDQSCTVFYDGTSTRWRVLDR